MKRFLFYAISVCVTLFSACEYDDSEVWSTLNDYGNRIAKLEQLCAQMNTNISSLQTIVNALQQKDFITTVAPITQNGKEIGYSITFSSGKSITIYHGNDGKDGQDGKDGKDGYTPIIGVKQASDGIYYWTIDGNWLLDEDGNKIKAVGTDGKDGQDGAPGKDGADGATGPQGPQGPAGADGQDGKDGADGAVGPQGPAGTDGKDGKDGITPQLKIEDDYWYVSYDNGETWVELGKATSEGASGSTGAQGPQGEQGAQGPQGPQGPQGEKGDSFFQNVTQDDHNVYFTLADGTVLTVAKYVELQLFFDVSALKNVKVNSEVKVDYTVTGSAQKVEIEVMPSNDLRAEAVADDATKKSGHILIRTGSSFDSASKVVVLVSDGDKVVMKSISLQVVEDDEAAQLYVYNGATKNIGAAGGAVTLSFLTNVDCEAVIPDDAKSWISVAGTRALENKHITLNVAQNTSDRRSAKVKVQSKDGKLSVEYTISQAGTASSSNPEAGDDGTILGTPAKNEIFYTSTNGKVVEPNKTEVFGGAIVSNTYANGVGVIVFDREITAIGESAFSGHYFLKSISLPNSVTSIGDYAFSSCNNLTSITIPDSVTTIGQGAISDCSRLTSVTIPDSVTTFGGGAFSYCSSLISITIPDSVTAIVGYTFYGCSNLTSITIPDRVTEIGGEAFYGCSNLTSINIPDSVTEIGNSAFYKCSSLTSITIPDSVTEIRFEAFYGCQSLKKAIIGSGVKKIGYSAFENCYFLNEIICKPTTPPTAILDSGKWNAFKSIGTSAKIYVPVGSGAAYKAANYWSDYASIIEEKAM